jgi:hypothetical protein
MQHALARFGKRLVPLRYREGSRFPQKRKASARRINIGFPLNPFRAGTDLTMLGI